MLDDIRDKLAIIIAKLESKERKDQARELA